MLDEFELIDTFTTKEGTVNIYANGLLESTVHEGAYLDVAYLRDGKTRIEEALKGKKAYVLNDCLGHYRISREARQLSASEQYSSHIAATAVIVNNAAVRLVLDLYMSIDKPYSPTRAFTKREEALKWLLEEMEAHQQKSG
jgi:hypothetical protein